MIRQYIEDRPWLLRLVAPAVSLALLGLLLLVSACGPVGGSDGAGDPTESPRLDLAAKSACNEFALWQSKGADPTTRPALARKVHAEASNSNVEIINDKAERLFAVAQQDDSNAWTLVADSFAYECMNLGWTADDAR